MLRNLKIPIIMLSLVFLAGLLTATVALAAPVPQAGDRLSVAGAMKNPQGRGVKEVEVEVLVNGQHVKAIKNEDITTGKSGAFLGEFILPAGTLPAAKVEVKAFKPSWVPFGAHCRAGDGGGYRMLPAISSFRPSRTSISSVRSPRPSGSPR